MHTVGTSQVTKVFEANLDGLTFGTLLPGLAGNAQQAHPEWFPEGTVGEGGIAKMSLHVWLVRHRGLNILIDTGAGNDKPRPQQLVLDHLQTRFLERLAQAGAAPEDIDVVLHTHIHSDHVGWDTRLVEGSWVPTFPNAEIVVSDLEYRYGAALTASDASASRAATDEAGMGQPVRLPVSGTFADSIMPLVGTVPVRRIRVDGSEVFPGIRFVSTPGHSIDHASIELIDDGDRAFFSGDVFHHPVEVYDPDLVSVFCEFPDASRKSRRRFLAMAADTGALVFSSHFPLSSVGRISRFGEGFGWTFVD